MPFYVRKHVPPGSIAASGGFFEGSLSHQQIRLLLGLYAGYCSMMFSRAAMDVAIPLILQDEATGIDPRDIGTLLTLCSFFYLFGKISMGYSVDQVGPRLVFLGLASFASAGLTCLISFSHTAARMTFLMCALCVAQSSGWAAITSMISLWLQPSQYAMAFGILSTSSRMGDLASKVALGRAVASGWDWRSLFILAAALQLFVAFLNLFLLPKATSIASFASAAPSMSFLSTTSSLIAEDKKQTLCASPQQRRPSTLGFHGAGYIPDREEQLVLLDTSASSPPRSLSTYVSASLSQIWAIARTPRFRSMALAIAALHIVMEFDKYIPLYLHRSLGLSPGLAAQGAALYPLSQLLALGLAGVAYDRLKPRGRLLTVGALCLGVAGFFALQVLLLLTPSALLPRQNIFLLLIFCAGFCVAVPYYLPPSIYLAEVGGKGKCGTLSGVLDASGGVTSMGFHYGVGYLVARDRWGLLLGVVSVCALVGFRAMTTFHEVSLALDGSRAPRQKKNDLLPETLPTLPTARTTTSYMSRTNKIGGNESKANVGASHLYNHQPPLQYPLKGPIQASVLSRLPLIGHLIPRARGMSWMSMKEGKPAVGAMMNRKKERKDSNDGNYQKHLAAV